MLKSLWKMTAAPAAPAISLLIALSTATTALADDTELYSAKTRPKVLIVFDDSASMSEIVEGIKPKYDPNATYVEKVPPNRIYWSTTAAVPNVDVAPGKNQWFNASANSCASSHTALEQSGMFAGKPLRWQTAVGAWYEPVCDRYSAGVCTNWRFGISFRFWYGHAAAWVGVDTNVNIPYVSNPYVNNPYSVDCYEDVAAENADNADGIGDGYPRTASAADAPNTDAYTTLPSGSNVTWGTKDQHFFTSHYINWYYDDTIVPADRDYLEIAQGVIENVIRAHPGIDFGLTVFNNNIPAIPNTGGGRVVKRIVENMTAADRDNLVDTLWGLDHLGNTPLCETAWEAYLYMTGGKPKFAKSADPRDVPLRDEDAESGDNYVSPLAECPTFIIYMTDGLPTADTEANTDIIRVTGKSCRTYTYIDPVFQDEVSFQSCLAPLTEHMAANDLNGAVEGTQSVKAATIGFNINSAADGLLKDAATMTKPGTSEPAYYNADDEQELVNSFNEIIGNILATEQTMTSPAVAVDSFTRTQSRDDVFLAMFEPVAGADWLGNIKKFKLKQIDGEPVVVDADDKPAFTEDGPIDVNARSFWSAASDGAAVTSGGVGEVLRNTPLNTRDVLSNTGTDGELEPLSAANVDAAAYGMDDAAELHAFWQVANEADLADTIRWGYGYDVDDADADGNRDETRKWIMADILHSSPLVVNYGARGNYTAESPDLRIVAGTNNGLLHMFSNKDGTESWAFFPKELGPVLTQRRKNIRDGENVYGVDGRPVVYTVDANRDGTLDHTAGDKVYLYFGLRRGGNRYYALDISNPDAPVFLWSISPDNPGFAELGQSWSAPSVTRIAAYKDDKGNPAPVLVFGGGYDASNDDRNTLADTVADQMGRGVFIVDAISGELVWSVTPAANSATNMQASALVHAIAADVKTMDSNGDALADRIYAADVGGNVWRIDLPGSELPTSSQSKWLLTHLLDANDNTKSGDRRFFNAVEVARTVFEGTPVDAVLIGSGDRTNPIATDAVDDPTTDDQFYMIRDKRTVPYVAALDSAACDDEPPSDFRCELPIKPEDPDDEDVLYDITDNDIQSENKTTREKALDDLAKADGWRLDLTEDGEKSLSRSLTIAGKVYFTTYTPAPVQEICKLARGFGRLYVVDLLTGGEVIDFNSDDDKERAWPIFEGLLDTPSLIVTDDGEIWGFVPLGDSGEATIGSPFNTGDRVPGPYGTYWNRGEY